MKQISLRSARVNAHLTQKELGEIVGVHENTIAKWENDPAAMSIRNAEIVCKALDVSMSDIFFSSTLQNVENQA